MPTCADPLPAAVLDSTGAGLPATASALALFAPLTPPGPDAGQPTRQAIAAACRTPESQALDALLPQARLPPGQAAQAHALALRLAAGLRARGPGHGSGGLVQGLLQAYALNSQEGVALMCLAEALLRIPDAATRDALIRDKLAAGRWQEHLGRSPSAFVNAATWGLLLSGRLAAADQDAPGLGAALTRLLARGGEPLVRQGVQAAMRLLGAQFVAGETIGQALARAVPREREGFRHSYDMLGEAARTAQDAARYLQAYEEAVDAIGAQAAGRGPRDGPGISVKLSALHPRYARAQHDRVLGELLPVLAGLCERAARHGIGLSIDAEEADRMDLSLDLFGRLCALPSLRGWDGLGIVVQAYQKRCPAVIDHLVQLARRSGRRLPVRLVKGAYWDTEIARAQAEGQDGYPVWTRKAHTDAAWLACARRLLAAPDAVYPQFATHNAHSLAAVHALADPARWQPGQYEFQCLHGMGEALYAQVVAPEAEGGLARPCRIYAPVGTHETLLAYLVRRLLENGANSSFVHRIADPAVPLEDLVADPVAAIDAQAQADGVAGRPHPAIPLPADLYGATRRNAPGLDLADEAVLQRLGAQLREASVAAWSAPPLLAADAGTPAGLPLAPVINPAVPGDQVGTTREAMPAEVEAALAAADQAAPAWAATPPAQRARVLDAAADRLLQARPALLALLVREAGKTLPNALAEWREAVDFLRDAARQLRGWGEGADVAADTDAAPLGPVACISPWNFPLAIFVGQVATALAAGNVVLAKPAEQAPLVAAEAVRLLRAAGVPPGALQLLPGRGEVVGAALVADARVQGVLFTGSTEVARLLQRSLAGRTTRDGRAVPLVAETGGQNAMVVDASALPEQVVADVLASAFDSAGQRCSALRVLCLQEEVADRILAMLRGAMDALRVGRPDRLATDVGPVIDAPARAALEAHLAAMAAAGLPVHRGGRLEEAPAGGHFVRPALVALDGLHRLQREVFGPVLHVLRWRRDELDTLLAQIEATGYALTFGLHTRIDATVAHVAARVRAGNVYVNRNMVGAVVGVQPFGGEGLSGTGPKAGGPLALPRLLARRPADLLHRALQGWGRPAGEGPAVDPAPLQGLADWAATQPAALGQGVATASTQLAARVPAELAWLLPGPAGERNVYRLLPRTRVLCLADDPRDRLLQLAGVLAVGGRAAWPRAAADLHARLPAVVRARVDLVDVDADPAGGSTLVLLHGTPAQLLALQQRLAAGEGPLVQVERMDPGDAAIPLERLLVERVLTVNTAAAGGNAALLAAG